MGAQGGGGRKKGEAAAAAGGGTPVLAREGALEGLPVSYVAVDPMWSRGLCLPFHSRDVPADRLAKRQEEEEAVNTAAAAVAASVGLGVPVPAPVAANKILFVENVPAEADDSMLGVLFSKHPGFVEVRRGSSAGLLRSGMARAGGCGARGGSCLLGCSLERLCRDDTIRPRRHV